MTLDLIGLYNYRPDIFDGFQLPEDLTDSKDTIIFNLLMETASREIIYPDGDFLKSAISAWSLKQVHVWDELYKTTQYVYNPIWNKDGKKVEDRDLKGTNYRTDDHTTTRTHLDTVTRTHGLTVNTDVGTYGFNSSTLAPVNKETAAQSGTTADAHTGTITDKDTGTVKHDLSDTGKITTTEQGNIGVTSTQSLIQEQREVVKFNILDVIIEDFANRFCLKVY